MSVDNLWGEISLTPQLKPPVAVLKEQGDMLEHLTKGMLTGRIARQQDGNNTVLHFAIVAPALNNYTYTVLQVRHAVELYPAQIYDTSNNRGWIACADETKFVTTLSEILQSEMVKKVISALMVQIQLGV